MLQVWDVNSLNVLLQFSRDLFCTIDHAGKFLQVSPSSKDILGYSAAELTGRKFIDFVHPQDKESSLRIVQEIVEKDKSITDFSNSYFSANGQKVRLSWSVIWDREQKVMQCLARPLDTPQERKVEQVRSELMLKSLVTQGSDMQALLDESGTFTYSSGSTSKVLGYGQEDLLGKNAFSFIHPNDLPRAQQALEKVLSSGQACLDEFRFKHANGEWRWLETVVTNQLQYPSINALVLSSRDVTDRVNGRLRLQESEQRFKALFLYNPDLVFYQDKNGILVDVNVAVLSYFNVEKSQVVNRPFIDLLPEKVRWVCENNFQLALAGGFAKFEMQIDLPGVKTKVFDVSKFPVLVNKEVVGVYSRLRDITDITNNTKIISQQAEKLASVFDSITDAFFLLDNSNKILFINKQFEKVLGLQREQLVGQDVWTVFPEEVNGLLFQKFQTARETGRSSHFEYYLKRLDKWLDIKGFPSEEGVSVYFSDISEKVKAKKELEKLSLVASKTINAVIITDAAGYIEWVNEAFVMMTGYTLEEVIGEKPGKLLQGPETNQDTIQRLRENIRKGLPFNETAINYRKSGQKFWISMDITPIRNEAGEIFQYIAVQKDITERKETEDQQQEMTIDLFRQNRDLQQFTYIISHNLRAPVANALGLSDLLTKTQPDSAVFQTSLVNLKKTVFKMDMVLRDLNMILSVRDKQDVMENELVDIGSIIDQVCQNFQEALTHCKANIQIDISEGVMVKGNRAYMYSIFYNLFSNAIKYRSLQRPLEIAIKCFGSETHGTSISFSDNGSGFDLQKAGPDVFKLYKRFHREKNGRGIGLFLVKTHIEAMGGQITVTSQVDVGTCFLIDFGGM